MGIGTDVSECVVYIRLSNEIINTMLGGQSVDKIIIGL